MNRASPGLGGCAPSLGGENHMASEHERASRLVQKLAEAPRFRFTSRSDIAAPTKHGVYAIFSRRGRCQHVGRTNIAKNGLQQRIRNHFDGRSSFVILHLKRNQRKLLNGYSYAWVPVRSGRMRALAEHLAVGTLCPVHLGTHDGKDRSRHS